VSTRRELEQALSRIAVERIKESGVVLEQNLEDVTMYSVGVAAIGDIRIAYCGIQNTTVNNDGKNVYGGFDLYVIRGILEDLVRLNAQQKLRVAIDQARKFDAGVRKFYSSMFASRCNYDVLQDVAPSRRWRSGLLEQSWMRAEFPRESGPLRRAGQA
jgi:hypothetical protein